MTDERLCGVCGHPESCDRDGYCWKCIEQVAYHPFEAAPSTDEGEARWERMEESPDYVVWRKRWAEGYSESSAVPKAIEAAIRAPLEAEVERLREALVKVALNPMNYLDWLTAVDSALATSPSSTEGTKEGGE